jgi:hypothetical protein
VGDIVFQYDPRKFLLFETFAWIPVKDPESIVPVGVSQSIVVASEGVKFKDNRWTRDNLRMSFPDFYDYMCELPFYNAGSFAAKAGILRDLAHETFAICMTKSDCRSHDQAALNILLQSAKYRDQTLFTGPNDTWCYCAASSMFASPEDAKGFRDNLPVVRNGKCYVKGEYLTCMFHHYIRDRETTRQVRRWVEREYFALSQVGQKSYNDDYTNGDVV